MKLRILVLLMFCLASNAFAESKPYKRALILPGAGLNNLVFVGMYEALEKYGLKPDVVIGTCGGAIAASVIHAYPEQMDRHRFLLSPKMHQFLLSVDLNVSSIAGRALGVWSEYSEYGKTKNQKVPDLFVEGIVDLTKVPALKELSFEPRHSSDPALVLVGTELLFNKSQAGQYRGNSKLLRETYFTDSKTAQYLRGLESTIAQQFPKGAVDLQTVTISDENLNQAMRVSVTDPYIEAPYQLKNGKNYIGGNVNLTPVEVGFKLADEIIMPFDTLFGTPYKEFAQLTYGFDMNERIQYVNTLPQGVSYLFDKFELIGLLGDASFEPNASSIIFGGGTAVPKDLKKYQKAVQAQIQHGFDVTEAYILKYMPLAKKN